MCFKLKKQIEQTNIMSNMFTLIRNFYLLYLYTTTEFTGNLYGMR